MILAPMQTAANVNKIPPVCIALFLYAFPRAHQMSRYEMISRDPYPPTRCAPRHVSNVPWLLALVKTPHSFTLVHRRPIPNHPDRVTALPHRLPDRREEVASTVYRQAGFL